MKFLLKSLFFIGITCFAVTLKAQGPGQFGGGGGGVSSGSGAPSGSCSGNQLYVDVVGGNLYDCKANVWNLVTGGGGGSGTVNNCTTTGALAEYTGSGTTVGCGNADFTYSTHTLAGGASGIFDLSALTAGNIKLPGTSGGIPYFSSANVWASSGALTQFGVLFGGGAGGAPTSSAQGATNAPLIGQGASNPIFSSILYPSSMTSGAIVCGTSTTQLSSSVLLNQDGVLYGGGAGVCPSSIAGTTDNRVHLVTQQGNAGAVQAPTAPALGQPIDACNTTASYTIQSGTQTTPDDGRFKCQSGSTASAWTIGQAGSAGWDQNYFVIIANNNTSGNVTVTATTSTFRSSGTTSLVITPGMYCSIVGDASNWNDYCHAIIPSGTGGPQVSVTPVTANGAVSTDQQLMELSLPAGFLNVSKQPYWMFGAGVFSTAAAQTPTLTFKAKLCTVSGCGSGTVVTLATIVSTAATASTTNNNWRVSLVGVTATTGATGNLETHGDLGVDLGASTAIADSLFGDTNTAVSSNIDLTAALFLDFTVAESTGSATVTITQRSGAIMPQSGGVSSSSGGGGGTTTSYYMDHAYNNSQNGSVANQLFLVALTLPVSLAGVNHLVFDVTTADGTNNSAICVYNSSGTEVMHTAAATYASTGIKTAATVESNASLSPGKYYLGWTSVATTLQLQAYTNIPTFYVNSTFIATAGGACPASITPPTDAPTIQSVPVLVGFAP